MLSIEEKLEKIKSDMSSNATTIPPIGKILKFQLDDKVMVIDGSGGANVVSLEDCEADCTIKMSMETYEKLQTQKLKPMIAIMTGKIKVSGDLSLAAKLKKLM